MGESINCATVVRGMGVSYTDEINSCYNEFLRLRPVIKNEEAFYILLRDAVTSLVKYLAKGADNTVLSDNTNCIVDLAERYARIYFTLDKNENCLLMLRAALYDVIRGYDCTNAKYDTLTRNMYESIRKLIVV